MVIEYLNRILTIRSQPNYIENLFLVVTDFIDVVVVVNVVVVVFIVFLAVHCEFSYGQ